MAERDHSIDIMRAIGLISIFLAHAGVKDWFFQFRCFDVPMMLFISGLSYSGRSTGNWFKFAWKRATRLLIPLYIVLTVYFLVKLALHACLGTDILPEWAVKHADAWHTMLGSYALFLNPSIGKVWIFRVFLVVMLVTPPLVWLEKKIASIGSRLTSALIFLATIAAMFAVLYFAIDSTSDIIDISKKSEHGKLDAGIPARFWADWVLYTLGYSIPFFLGCRMRQAKLLENAAFTLILGIAFTIGAFYVSGALTGTPAPKFEEGQWLYFQKLKYPPHAYYILWGCVMSAFIWLTKNLWIKVLDWAPLRWLGRNTIWIYLWHMPMVAEITKPLMKDSDWPIKLLVLVILAGAGYGIQYFIVSRLEKKHPDWKALKYFKG